MNNLAPLCLFTFNRIEETKRTVEALKNNYLAHETELYIFSDGPKNETTVILVNEVREYLRNVTGFRKIEIMESEVNLGLANSIISGVSMVLKKYGKAIVLEDDLITSKNFLDYMNQALDFYENDPEIISVSGYTLDLPSLPGPNDFYFGIRASSWGWGTWSNRWENIDWEIKGYSDFIKDSKRISRFNSGGSDLAGMLKNQVEGKIDSWAIRFCFSQFNQNLKTVFPTVSKLRSIGFSGLATHTKGTSRFDTPIDSGEKRDFVFDKFLNLDDKLIREFKNKFSYRARGLDKIRSFFSS